MPIAPLVILDEIHHAGDSLPWGDGARSLSPMRRRLAPDGYACSGHVADSLVTMRRG